MSHWRDGGIGNVAGIDDRPIEEWTMLEKLASIATAKVGGPMPRALQAQTKLIGEQIPLEGGGSIGLASSDWGSAMSLLAKEAFDEIQRRRWQPIDTAPVAPWTPALEIYYRFRCLLQFEKGYVGEGWAYYVLPPRSRPLQLPKLRWADGGGRQRFPKYWMPLPAPRVEP